MHLRTPIIIALSLVTTPLLFAGAAAADSPCGDWDEGLVPDQVEPCILVRNPPPNCVGPWFKRYEGSLGPVAYEITTCAPPGGGPTLTSARAHEEPTCEGKTYSFNDGIGQNEVTLGDDCTKTVVHRGIICLGGSVKKTQATVAGNTIIVYGCGNPDQGGPLDLPIS